MDEEYTEEELLLIDIIKEKTKITRKEVEEVLEIGTTKAFKMLKKLCEQGVIVKKGNGNMVYYVLK